MSQKTFPSFILELKPSCSRFQIFLRPNGKSLEFLANTLDAYERYLRSEKEQTLLNNSFKNCVGIAFNLQIITSYQQKSEK